ncbi:MAG: dipeptide epimerase [Alphaproteobacteria bacterium]|nr:dipeptide epimerase [Alphaproteobacteria bacterium]
MPAEADSLTITEKAWPTRGTFALSRGTRTEVRTLQLALLRGGVRGVAEAVPYARYGETPANVREQISKVEADIMGGAGREDLPRLLPPGAARNLCDLALWDWEAKSKRAPVWRLAGLPQPQPALTAFTLSLAAPEAMAAAAREAAAYPLLKLKLGTPEDLPRLRAVRQARGDAQIIVDANEGWSADDLRALAPELAARGVVLCEQPLPAANDEALRGLELPFPLCADESVHTAEDLPRMAGLYQAVNVKLDKAGGLTPALHMARAAREQGFRVMLGCMVASSLAVAPAALLAPLADWVDLDGPLLLAADHAPALVYKGAWLQPAPAGLWG